MNNIGLNILYIILCVLAQCFSSMSVLLSFLAKLSTYLFHMSYCNVFLILFTFVALCFLFILNFYLLIFTHKNTLLLWLKSTMLILVCMYIISLIFLLSCLIVVRVAHIGSILPNSYASIESVCYWLNHFDFVSWKKHFLL